ncbi:hypothetical protein QYE76_066678 [Lolium multiflorum]|uniref:CCHC-type domain-containing protein n=1 Tax=Lolium multiflorum TaxID=4521 RepID=A0AAD8WA77_LOLMU|nr:hypothetical protein QYE76_066678 [Lolium multiflorum]
MAVKRAVETASGQFPVPAACRTDFVPNLDFAGGSGRALSPRGELLPPHHGNSDGGEDGGGDGFRGQFPVPAACRNRDFCPPNLDFAMAAALEDKTLLDTTCSGSFTRNKEEFKRDLLDRIKENAEDWENDKGKESGYADKPPFKPLPPKEGNEEKEKKKKKGTKKKKKKENKKKEVTAYPRVNEITLGLHERDIFDLFLPEFDKPWVMHLRETCSVLKPLLLEAQHARDEGIRPRRRNLEDEENMYGKLKFNMPKFKGEDDAEAYLSWALKVDKIFRIHNFSGAKKVAMASLEFEDYANTWWEQVVTLREEKGEPPIDTWEEMKEEMQARFVPTHYTTDLFNKLQKLKQGTKTVEEFFKEMELTMMRANIQESENQTIARFFNGLNYPIKRIVEFQQYSNMVELVHQASKAERQVNEDIKYSKSKQYFASKLATPTPKTSVKPSASSTTSKQPTIQSRMKQTVTSTASSKASTGPSNVTCFKCGTQGHKSFECKNTKVMITMENGDIETLSEGEYEALVQAAVANEEDYDEESGEDPLLCIHDPSPSLVVTRVLTTQPQAMEDQRCNIFQTRAGIGGKSIKVIIDGGSCHNLASTELCEKLNLTLRKHPHPYHVQWLSDKGNVKIQHTVTVNFKIGPYEDTIECDVVPMTVCHMLLDRPWQFDKKAIHDGYSNAYTFTVKDKKFELRPMTPSQIIADNAKALARAQQHNHHSELRGEGATHQKESERHKPYMSERKSEFQDVFPDELPHGLPPLRGIEHRIDLIPGAPLPNRAAYRTNPEDTKEIQRQIQDLLAKGNRTKEIFSELDEINAQGPIFPRSFRKTEGITKWGDEAPTQQGRAAWVGPAPPYGVGPLRRLLTYPFAYIKPSSRKPLYREPRYGKPSRDAAANPISGDSGDRLRHPAGEGNHHRRALHHHARLRIDA